MLFSEVMGCCKTSNPLVKHIIHCLYTFYIQFLKTVPISSLLQSMRLRTPGVFLLDDHAIYDKVVSHDYNNSTFLRLKENSTSKRWHPRSG